MAAVLYRCIVPLLAFFLVGTVVAQQRDMRVGLLQDLKVKRCMVMTKRGVYDVFVDGKKVTQITSVDGLKVERTSNGLVCKTLSQTFSGKQSIDLRSRQKDSAFRLRSLDHKMAERAFDGSLEVRIAGDALLLVNNVDLERYVEGVVLSEAGRHQYLEYYKLQAVSCRTYALTNQRKHIPEGFQVCDRVHCQVYKGRNFVDSIAQAVMETRNMVLVDSDIRLIHATFHSNCGGETTNAEDVWSKEEVYLRGTVDTFCVAGEHARWTRRIPRQEWLRYLKGTHQVDITSSAQLFPLLDQEPSCRGIYLNTTPPLIPLKQVRADWKLNSAYFSIRSDAEYVVLEGRGFGHGVGVCQEGAMEMARKGFTFTDILHYYYAEVHLVDLGSLDFFRDLGR